MLQKIKWIATLLKYKWWVIGAAVIIGALWLYAGRKEKNPYKEQQKELRQEDKTTEKLIDALKQSMNQNDRLITIHEKNSERLLDMLQNNRAAIQQNQKQTDEDIKRVRTLDDAGIKRAFAELERLHNVPAK